MHQIIQSYTRITMSLSTSRIKKELEIIQSSDSPGVSCWLVSEENLSIFEAGTLFTFKIPELDGPEDSPYQNGRFKLHIQLPSRFISEGLMLDILLSLRSFNFKLPFTIQILTIVDEFV